ncbi:MAG: Hcp family type VI secretion system effector [Candidatus Tectimicrobiota bacterium]
MATNMYLKITGPNVDGESKDLDHEKWIEVLSYQHGVSQPTSATASTSGGRTTERCHHQDLVITKYMDASTPILNKHCCQGTHLTTIELKCYRATTDGDKPVEYMAYKLENSIISSVTVGGGPGDIPVETVTFNYGKITWVYKPQAEVAPGGVENGTNIPASWDLVTNQAA